MSTRFYAGQKDYIVQLNLMDDQFSNTTNSVTNDTTTNASYYPTFSTTSSGPQNLKVSSTKLFFNPSTGLLTATGFSGPLTGNVTGNLTGTASQATNATNIGTTNDVATNAAHFVVFLSANSGNNAAKVASTKLTFNPSTGVLTATGFSGPLTGNVTGNVTGALTGNADTATKLATARAINGTNFDGSAAITITANTPNSVTFNNGGAGAVSGTAFTGAAAVVVSYNTLGCGGTAANNTWTGTNTFSNNVTLSGATNDLGTGTGATTTNVAAGATTTGNTKTVNIGTGGLAGSTTNITFGNAAGNTSYTFLGFSGVIVPAGTAAQRPGGTPTGVIRLNTDTGQFEGHNGTAWGGIGGGAKGGGSDAAFFENDVAITTNYTITTNKNAMTAGPVTINTGVTVTVPTGSTWSIV